MLALMDAFAQAVEEARQRLVRDEGRHISNRELARRAGIKESTLAYHLSDKRTPEGRRIPADMVRKLAEVLHDDDGELMRAAQVASGYEVADEELPEFGTAVVRYLSQPLSRDERMRAMLRLQEIMAEEMRKIAEDRNGT